MTWAATIQARDGLVEVRLSRASEAVQMAPEVARTLAATLLVVAESADQGQDQDAKEQESTSDG
ncbi:MAG: hypothetical protein JW940_09645 [Polyangiaceae bacterium]|nr:hypothetical protein [Polyangiaceae bacterium]